MTKLQVSSDGTYLKAIRVGMLRKLLADIPQDDFIVISDVDNLLLCEFTGPADEDFPQIPRFINYGMIDIVEDQLELYEEDDEGSKG